MSPDTIHTVHGVVLRVLFQGPAARFDYFSISGTIRRGRNSDTLGQMISAASTSSIGINMMTVSLSA